jgi:hypothetical protein
VRIKTTVQESQQNKIEKNNDRSGRIVKKKKKNQQPTSVIL